ncbi:hypothetical protein [Paenibacillus terrae]|uniref:hypothetical protein n=1 Tax=Paenibacillus terrae TaxID=159743 RepID=UPI0011EB6CA2|nr:hypothetical protein [Paenibacillus terrae]
MMPNTKANKQVIKTIVRMGQVWEQTEENEEAGLHYYHITDALNRQWQTIGVNVTDAIQVFENGNDGVWTRIIQPAPFYPDLTTHDLIHMLSIGPEAWRIRNAIQIILNNVERRNAFVNRIVNVNDEDVLNLLYNMKKEFLKRDQLSNQKFMDLYAVNPVEALSVYFLESVDVHTYWEWSEAGGTYSKAIQYKQVKPEMTLAEAIEKAEAEARDLVSGY